MAKGTRKTVKKEAIAKIDSFKQTVMPDLVGQSFAACNDVPSRSYQKGAPIGTFGSMRSRFNNLYDGIMPFQSQQGYISIKDAVWLCQKAFFNVAIFRNAITTMADLANTDIYLEGGNAQSKDFFGAWMKRINIWRMKDGFFRELFRSGNVFYFRVDGNLTKNEAYKINQTYSATAGVDIPLRYIMLNVADIAAFSSVTSYDTPVYYKILTPEQLKQLKNSKNPDDKQVVKSLRQSMKEYFDTGGAQLVPIDTQKLHTIFYQKQDYEPFAVPMGYSVLDDINLKLEFKRTDAVLARTVEYVILSITMGSDVKPDGTGGVNQKSIAAMQELFRKEAVGRVLISDHTTKLDWAIPDLSKVLGPQKYEVVNEDIAGGLMDIFFGQQKFANLAGKLKVFVEKLNTAQEIFLNDFLNPEIKRIAGQMAFKSYPIARFSEVNLDDPTQTMRIFTQLLQLGALTPQDTIEAISTGELPPYEDLVVHQEAFKEQKDKGLFQPIVAAYPPERVAEAQAKFPKPVAGGNTSSKPASPSKSVGRPPGTKAPQTTKRVGPIGTGSEQEFSMAKLIENIKLSDKIRDQITTEYKILKSRKRLNEKDKSFIEQIATSIFENESPELWEEKVSEYLDAPLPPNPERVGDIEEIADSYELSHLSATLLYNSKI